jgi:hypothetical protein
LKRIRGGSGLGDSIYLRPIVDHFIKAGERVQVCSNHPDVFIGSGAEVEPFGRTNINVLAHYVGGKPNPNTNQWQDICASAGVGEIPLRFDWEVRNKTLIDTIVSDSGRQPIILVHGGRTPMGRSDGFGLELLPDRRAFDAVLSMLHGCYTARIGKGEQLYPLPVTMDLTDGTSVSDLLDIASICDGIVAQCSFAIPLAEIFNKPLLTIWAAGGMSEYRHPYIRSITPSKVLSKPSSKYVIDDWAIERLMDATYLWKIEAARAECWPETEQHAEARTCVT